MMWAGKVISALLIDWSYRDIDNILVGKRVGDENKAITVVIEHSIIQNLETFTARSPIDNHSSEFFKMYIIIRE